MGRFDEQKGLDNKEVAKIVCPNCQGESRRFQKDQALMAC